LSANSDLRSFRRAVTASCDELVTLISSTCMTMTIVTPFLEYINKDVSDFEALKPRPHNFVLNLAY
jgi:hypothetical protein